MKLRKLFVFALFAALAAPGFADNQKVESDGYDLMAEMVLRPFGIVATIIGAGVYAGVSPVTALFMIPKPHNSFVALADTIICKPFKWTVMRPVGDYRYNEGCARKVQPVAYQQPSPHFVESPQPVVSETEPPIEYHQDINKKLDAIYKKEMMK